MVDYNALEQAALAEVAKHTAELEAAALYNTEKVIAAFRNNMVSDYYLKPTTGYGYSDVGRDTLDLIYAELFKTEAALVRSQFVSGTHALAVALLGNLRAGDELIAVTGAPYDTMQTIIGSPVKTPGSLVDLGVTYKEIPMTGDHVDLEAVKKAVTSKTTMIHIQRSCGYSSERKTIDVAEIGRICSAAKEANPNVICFVDNCYGEFVDYEEPTQAGADIMAGSLIKNPGGGIAPTGGYIVGRDDLVELASYRLTAPGMGDELGASLSNNRLLFQGLFLAPHVVSQAIKGAIFAAGMFAKLGYKTLPLPTDVRGDIIQAIELGSADKLIAFCGGIQKYSPVDSFAAPEPWDMPGYADKIIMAAGTFVQGASIEFSADGPLRAPYNVYLQGGLTFEHAIIGIMGAAQAVLDLDETD